MANQRRVGRVFEPRLRVGGESMFFQQFYNQGLGHASYRVGSQQTGEAFVFDPRRDVGCYFEAARTQGLRIRYGLDSHGHNDHLSG